MKKLLLLSVLMLAVSSCYKEHSIDDGKEGDNTKPSTDVMKHLPTDQSRIIRYNGAEANTYSSRAVTRANEDASHPLETEPDVTGIQEYRDDLKWSAEELIIKETTPGDTFEAGNVKRLYIAKPNVKISVNDRDASNPGTIYILSSATNVDFRNQWYLADNSLKKNWTYKVWGSLITDELSFNQGTSLYYYGDKELVLDGFNQSADRSDIWFESHGPVRFRKDVLVSAPNTKFWFGGETYFEGKFKTDNNYNYFTFAGPVEFNGPAGANGWDAGTYITRGNFDFQNSVKFNDLYITNDVVDITFNQCATIRNFGMGGGNTRVSIKVNYFIEFPDGLKFENGSVAEFLLDDAVMIIGGESEKNNSGKNVFINGHYVEAKGNSAIYIQGSVTGEMPYLEHRVFRYFKTTEGEGNTLAVFGKRWKNGNNETITEEPVIYVGWASGGSYDQDYRSEGYNTMFEEGNVIVNPIDLDDNFVIDSNDPYDCRADYTWGTQPPTQDEILPPAEHKYSATGLAFDGDYIYICWHSNLPGGEMQDGEEHDHGTNMDPDNDDDNYGGPSVDDNEDWGGIIDIVHINNYHPDNAELYIASTVLNHEHKYNHVKFYDNKLYLASTSWNVGAALHVVPIISTPNEGVGLGFDSENSYRVNLTGKSANCVEIVDNKSIVTISGRSIGGLNWFPLTDESNQSRLYINGDTENYGGKFIYDDGNGKIYAFHNTDAATITTYDYNGNQVGSDWKLTDDNGRTIPLVPYDGKNTIMVKKGKLYACCGRSGLYVFDTESHSMVGRSKLSANCVDVDDSGYIYVATGGGLAVLKFNDQNLQADTKELNTINYVAYTGKGFKYPNGWEEDKTMPDGTAKQSSNYVRVMGGKVFIAYGMYGLRIYTVSELLNPKK